jgi:hypothetical protein
MDIDWNHQLAEQLDWHWRTQLRARFDGLSDEEYFWEPVVGCWSIRPRGQSAAVRSVGVGAFALDLARLDPDPAPVTTIAWLLGHIIAAVLGERNARHFDGPPTDYLTFGYAGTAKEALAQLDAAYAAWLAGVKSLGSEGLARPCGPLEGPYSDRPIAELVLHTNREIIHHGSAIAQLRDLYLWKAAV